MNPHSGINDNNKKDRTKATATIPMAGAIVTAALLLSGLSLISSYQQPVIAQGQNMTGGGGGNATTTGGAAGGNQSEVRFHLEEARTALQNGDTQGAMMHLDLALSTLGGGAGGGNMTGTTGGATNMTTGGTEGGGGGGTEGGGGVLEGIFGGGGGG